MEWEYWVDKAINAIESGFQRLQYFVSNIFIPLFKQISKWLGELEK